jgi:hypothetical protein
MLNPSPSSPLGSGTLIEELRPAYAPLYRNTCRQNKEYVTVCQSCRMLLDTTASFPYPPNRISYSTKYENYRTQL